jgi:hypothetical protein
MKEERFKYLAFLKFYNKIITKLSHCRSFQKREKDKLLVPENFSHIDNLHSFHRNMVHNDIAVTDFVSMLYSDLFKRF